MDIADPKACEHPDIRNFEELRCCVSCGFALALPPATTELALSDDRFERSWGEPYRYRALNFELGQEIRLIVLKPGDYSDDVECEIVHANLLDKPHYEALSYTWADENGDDTPTHRVLCTGSRCIIRITANCDAALRRLRHRTRSRTVWVDAICIDQNNINERNHQVRKMRSIYTLAEQVVIYLGEQSRPSREVFRYLAKTIVIRRGDSVDIAFPDRTYAPSRETMKDFLNRRWFHRTWIIQEVGLARKATIVCGTWSLDWSLFSFEQFKQGVLSSQADGGVTPGVLLLQTRLFKQKLGFLDLLHAGRNSLSKDPRDKVFALLSLGDGDWERDFQPDYSTPVEWLFTHVALQLIEKSKSLNVLSHVRGRTNLTKLPSWVPDWTLLTSEEPLKDQYNSSELAMMADWDCLVVSKADRELLRNRTDIRYLFAGPLYRGSRTSVRAILNGVKNRPTTVQRKLVREVPTRFYKQDNTLATVLGSHPTRIVLRGHRLAVVESIMDNIDHDCSRCRQTPEDAVLVSHQRLCAKAIQFWGLIFDSMRHISSNMKRAMLFNFRTPSAFGSSVECHACGSHTNPCDIVSGDIIERHSEMVRLALINSITHHGVPSNDVGTDDAAQTGVIYHNLKNYYGSMWSDIHYRKEELDAFLEQVRLFGAGRVLFRTRNSLGLGPKAARNGDVVWLLQDMNVAMVLRKIDSHYVVIGECHLHAALRPVHPCSRCGTGVELADVIETKTIEIR